MPLQAALFNKTEIQRCIIHQIRNSTRYVPYKDVKAFTAALKPIYKAPTEEAALAALELRISTGSYGKSPKPGAPSSVTTRC